MDKRLLVVGATGDVGQGIVAAGLQSGWRVVAAGRSEEKLTRLRDVHPESDFSTVAGDITSEEGAIALWQTATQAYGGVDAAVVSVNAPNELHFLQEWSAHDLHALFYSNVLTHFIAAKTFIPCLPIDGIYIGIGGGTADFIIPKMGHISMGQAALRMMYRSLVKERREGSAEIRELMIHSMVNGASKRDRADPAWVTDVEVGQHVCAILTDPKRFPGPILTLKNKAQVGQPDIATAA